MDCFKFLGTTIAHILKGNKNIDSITKKAQQRLYFLRQLSMFGICKEIMVQFYRAVIESQLTLSISVWCGGLSREDKEKLNKIVKTASKIISTDLPSLDIIYYQRVINRATLIANDTTHPAHSLFQLLPSGRRYRSLKAKQTQCDSVIVFIHKLFSCSHNVIFNVQFYIYIFYMTHSTI